MDNFTHEEANQYLANLTKELTLQNPQTAKRLAKSNGLLQAPMLNKMLLREKLEASEVISDVPNQITVEGNPYAVRVESFNPAQISKLSKSLDGDGVLFGIYADPANYFDGTSNEVHFPVQILSKENGEYVTTEEIWSHPYAGDNDMIDDELNSAIDRMKASLTYPVFAVTMEEITTEEPEPLAKVNALGYLAFRAVNLKVERDGSTDEEFEMWWGPELGLIHSRKKFDGTKQNEPATGIDVRFPDVDHKNWWYNAQDSVNPYITTGLVPLDNTTIMAVTPWEDDQTAGKMARFSWYPDPNGNPTNAHTYTDIFNAGTNTVDDNKVLYMYVDQNAAYDEDDPYSEGALYRLTWDNVGNLVGFGPYFDTDFAVNHGLGDMTWRFGKK